MPIYEYQCRKCGEKFDKLVRSMSQDQAVECPSCGSKQTDKELSVFAVGAEGAGKSAPAPRGCGGCCQGGQCPME